MSLERTDESHRLDLNLAKIGLILSAILTVFLELTKHSVTYDLTGIFAGASCAIWIVMSKREDRVLVRSINKRSIFLLLFLLFLIGIILSVLEFETRPDQYIRPLSYFITTAVIAGILALEILFLPNHKARNICIILIQIAILSMSLSLSGSLIFPSVIGIDPLYHQDFTTKILETSHIPSGYYYSNFPVFHVDISLTSLVTGLEYKMSTIFYANVSQIAMNVLVIFLIGRIFFDSRVGLMCALFLSIANNNIIAGIWTEPITIAAILISMTILILLRNDRARNSKVLAIAILLMIVLILTHPIAAMMLAISLGFFVAFFTHGIRRRRSAPAMPVTWILATFYITVMFAVWTSSSYVLNYLAKQMSFGFNSQISHQVPMEIFQYQQSVPLGEQIFNNIGTIIFFSLAFIGCFLMISLRNKDLRMIIFVMISVTPLILSYFSLITGHDIVEGRWWYIAQILMSIPLGSAIILLMNKAKRNLIKSAFLAITAISLAFIMIMSSTANLDNRTFSSNTGVKAALTDSEIQAGLACQQLFDMPIRSDLYFEFTLLYSNVSIIPMDEQLFSGKFSPSNESVIIIRNEIENNPFYIFGSLAWRMNYNLESAINDGRFAKIYDCGTANGYIGN